MSISELLNSQTSTAFSFEVLPPLKGTGIDALFSQSFCLATDCVSNTTQIHTHMCYSEFNDIIADIARMDADVITIECSRLQMELLEVFQTFRYPNDIGPGVYDIHSARVPSVDEMVNLMKKVASLIPAERLWINPDCGLKTRDWEETKATLQNMLKATETIRKDYQK